MEVTNKTIAPYILLFTGIALAGIQLLSTGVNGETDSITHYQIARHAFKYPQLFFDHWGKPLFTLLSAPFAQLGYIGSVVFNLLCGLWSSWFAYLIAKRLGYPNAWAAIIFTVFTPVYLFIMYTSLTEILFSLILISTIYLFLSKRYFGAAILLSFIPFARTEGLMFIMLFIPALVWMKQYKALPLLFTGFLVYSLVGWTIHQDLLWFITKMPYGSNGSELYGSGSFWYYFGKMNYILNYPLLAIEAIGLVLILLGIRTGVKNLKDIRQVTLYFLIVPSFLGFILVQSFLWWQGMMGVLASTRFMACILPLGAILALSGFNWLLSKVQSSKVVTTIAAVLMISAIIVVPFTYKVVPMETGKNFAVMENLANWLKKSPYANHRAFYSDPMFPFYMDIDPYDKTRCFSAYTYENTNPAKMMKARELLIWDAQFSGFEGKLKYDSLIKNEDLRLVNLFMPKEDFTIIGGEKYKIAVFMKAPRDTTRVVPKQFYYNDFEKGLSDDQQKQVNTVKFKSGKQSIALSPEFVYSPAAEGKLEDLPGSGNITLKATVSILNPSADETGKILLVLSIDDMEHKVYKYITAKDTELKSAPGQWIDLSLTDVIDRSTPADGNYKVYVWYTGKNRIYIDDLRLEWMPLGVEGF